MQNFGMSMLWFWICYFLVTLVGILHTVFNIYVLHTKPTDAHSMGDGYEKKQTLAPALSYHLVQPVWLSASKRTSRAFSGTGTADRRSLGGNLHCIRCIWLGHHPASLEPELPGILYRLPALYQPHLSRHLFRSGRRVWTAFALAAASRQKNPPRAQLLGWIFLQYYLSVNITALMAFSRSCR